MNSPLTAPPTPRPTRGELIGLGLALVAAIVLRWSLPGRMAIEHFDEGVYASNYWFEWTPQHEYPGRAFYAPPLLPSVIEWLFLFGGPSDFLAILPNLVAGTATVVLAWRLSRQWFGPASGLATAWLAALSEPHAVFTRSALTDALLVAWFLVALGCLWRGLSRGQLSWSLVGGVFTGLACWTKYNGWLPLAIALAGAIPAGFASRLSPRGWGQLAAGWLIAVAAAVVVWLPCLWSLQPDGGYAAVAANHRGYVVGLDGWAESLERQTANLWLLEGALACVGLGTACLATGRCLRANDADQPGALHVELAAVGLSGVLFGAAALVGSAPLLALLTLVGFTGNAPWRRSDESSPRCDRDRLALWMALAWFMAMFVLAPLYRPYARLTLPWLAAAWIGAGAGVAHLLRMMAVTPSAAFRAKRARIALGLGIAVAAAGLALGAGRFMDRGVPPWQDRTELTRLSRKLAIDMRDLAATLTDGRADDVVCYTYGEPAVLFQLRLAGVPLVAPVADLSFAHPTGRATEHPTFLVAGPHAERDPEFQRQFAEVGDRLLPAGEYEFLPSELVKLDQWSASEIAGGQGTKERMRLYRLR